MQHFRASPREMAASLWRNRNQPAYVADGVLLEPEVFGDVRGLFFEDRYGPA